MCKLLGTITGIYPTFYGASELDLMNVNIQAEVKEYQNFMESLKI